MTYRQYLEIEQIDGVGDTIEVIINHDTGNAAITVSNDWAGDTETGFGESGNITLHKEQVKELPDFLSKLFNDQPG